VKWEPDANQWRYTPGFLAPGEYTAAFTCQAADDSPEEPANGIGFTESMGSPVTVAANQDSVVSFP
jgi:hypothetical protein